MNKIETERKIEELILSMKSWKKQAADAGKLILQDIIVSFFEANPNVAGLYWEQYTDYFNDGEPCEFQVHMDDQIDVLVTEAEAVALGFTIATTHEDGLVKIPYDDVPESLNPALAEVETLLTKIPDDVYLALFGDHCNVSAKRSGEFVVESMTDHD